MPGSCRGLKLFALAKMKLCEMHHNSKRSAVRRNRFTVIDSQIAKICRGCSPPKRKQKFIVLRGIQGAISCAGSHAPVRRTDYIRPLPFTRFHDIVRQ